MMKLVVLNDMSWTSLGIISNSPEHHSCHYLPLPHWQYLHRIQRVNGYRKGTTFPPWERIFPFQHWILWSLGVHKEIWKGEHKFLETYQKKCANVFLSLILTLKKYTNCILEDPDENLFYNWKKTSGKHPLLNCNFFFFFFCVYVEFYFPLWSLYLPRCHLRSSSLILSAILHTFFGVTIAIAAVGVTRPCLAWVPVAAQCGAWCELEAIGSTDSSDQTAFSSGPLYVAQSLA